MVVHNGTAFSLYVDGKLDTSGTSAAWNATGATYYIGSDALVAGRYFNGQLDEFKVFNYPLTQTQINMLYNLGALKY